MNSFGIFEMEMSEMYQIRIEKSYQIFHAVITTLLGYSYLGKEGK